MELFNTILFTIFANIILSNHQNRKMTMKKSVLLLLAILILTLQFNVFAQETGTQTNVLAKEIIDKYVEAIGGKELLSGVENRTTIMRGDIMGQNVTIIIKQKWPNKLRQEIKTAGMDQVIVYNGEKAVMKAAGQSMDISGKELDAIQIEANMDLLFDPESFGIKLSYEGEALVDSIPAHKIKMTLPTGIRWFQFYDKETGLKLKENKEMQTQMGLMEQDTYYYDYKEIEGKLYPFKIKQSVGPQSFEMNVSSVRINTEMSDSIFEIEEEPVQNENLEME